MKKQPRAIASLMFLLAWSKIVNSQFIAQTPAVEEPQNLVESAKKKNSDSKENNVQPQENPSLTEQ